jgi:transposase InsO family protein
MGSASHQLPPRDPSLDGRAGAGPSPDAAAGPSRPSHRPGRAAQHPHRYEHPRPGDLIHLDVKKLGRIPDGGGHKKLGRTIGNRNNNAASRGYAYLHHAIDDHTRLVYSEILTDQRKDTAAAFWLRAHAWFADAGITVKAVMTDNGSCYRSTTFHEALGPLKHRRTRPYRPQTNGKVERFNRTLAAEWAYAAIYLDDQARAATYPAWLHHYNHHRPHTGIGGLTPAARVHNLMGNYS